MAMIVPTRPDEPIPFKSTPQKLYHFNVHYDHKWTTKGNVRDNEFVQQVTETLSPKHKRITITKLVVRETKFQTGTKVEWAQWCESHEFAAR